MKTTESMTNLELPTNRWRKIVKISVFFYPNIPYDIQRERIPHSYSYQNTVTRYAGVLSVLVKFRHMFDQSHNQTHDHLYLQFFTSLRTSDNARYK